MGRYNAIPSIKALAAELTFQKQFIPGPEHFREDRDETRGIDVRLQVHDGSWWLHTGDSQYDQDHRGEWGSGFLTPRTNCRELARELIDEVEDGFAQTESHERLIAHERLGESLAAGLPGPTATADVLPDSDSH